MRSHQRLPLRVTAVLPSGEARGTLSGAPGGVALVIGVTQKGCTARCELWCWSQGQLSLSANRARSSVFSVTSLPSAPLVSSTKTCPVSARCHAGHRATTGVRTGKHPAGVPALTDVASKVNQPDSAPRSPRSNPSRPRLSRPTFLKSVTTDSWNPEASSHEDRCSWGVWGCFQVAMETVFK